MLTIFTAKLTGMKVEEFSIGFGPTIYQQQEGETLYSLRMLPLGGYNKIAGMDPDDPEDPERGFNSKPVTSRMLVILAGSLMNIFLPVLIFFGLFLAFGMDVPENKPVLGQIIEGYPAEQSGLKGIRANYRRVSGGTKRFKGRGPDPVY